MSRKNKKKNNKKESNEHSDYCKCSNCNELFYKENVADALQSSNKWKGETALIAKEIEKSTSIKQPEFKHAKSCMCVNCVTTAKENLQKNPTLDHTLNCICYKCKDEKMSGTGKSSSYTTPSTTAYTKCHEGNVFVFSMDGISVYGAGNMKDADPGKVDIVLDLDRNVKASTWANDLPKHFKSRKRATSKVRVLDLFIKDMHAPEHVTAEFWVDFWQDLVAEGKKLGKTLKVLVMCQGGHGRTGVVITSLLMASAYNKKGIPKDVHPVGWLRKNYCDKAVESLRQTDYLTKTWNLRFVSASKDSSYKGSSFYSKGAVNGAATTGSLTTDDNDSNTPADDEIPNADTLCTTCKTKRKANNRILFSGDIKAFECDRCFGIRADDDEEADGVPDDGDKEPDAFDQTEPCEGKGCFDNYNEMIDVWTTIHDEGCDTKKGDSPQPTHQMTDEEYAIWQNELSNL